MSSVLPYFPEDQVGLPLTVPVFPFPLLSVVVDPVPSSIFHQPTRPSVRESSFFCPTNTPTCLPKLSVFTCAADLAYGYIITSSIYPSHGLLDPSLSIPMYKILLPFTVVAVIPVA